VKETITATFENETFQKGEKVIAYNWFDKKNFGTLIVKYQDSLKLSEEDTCRKTINNTIRYYNIGVYKVVRLLPGLAKIVVWDRFDK